MTLASFPLYVKRKNKPALLGGQKKGGHDKLVFVFLAIHNRIGSIIYTQKDRL